jgi:hypothetical protein
LPEEMFDPFEDFKFVRIKNSSVERVEIGILVFFKLLILITIKP